MLPGICAHPPATINSTFRENKTQDLLFDKHQVCRMLPSLRKNKCFNREELRKVQDKRIAYRIKMNELLQLDLKEHFRRLESS